MIIKNLPPTLLPAKIAQKEMRVVSPSQVGRCHSARQIFLLGDTVMYDVKDGSLQSTDSEKMLFPLSAVSLSQAFTRRSTKEALPEVAAVVVCRRPRSCDVLFSSSFSSPLGQTNFRPSPGVLLLYKVNLLLFCFLSLSSALVVRFCYALSH